MVKNPECQAKELELDSVGNRSHWRILSRGGFCFYLCFRKSTVVWVERGELGDMTIEVYKMNSLILALVGMWGLS